MSDKICLIDKYLKELGFKEVEMSFIDSIAPYSATSLYAHRYDADAVWQLFGHVHSSPTGSGLDCNRLVHLFPYQYDVGVDNNNYTPISWEEVKKKIQHQIDGRGTISYKVYKLND